MDRESIVLLEENILRELFSEGKKNRRGKGGKCLEKEKEVNIWRRKMKKVLGEGIVFCYPS